eukprot:1157677-Pelagomonas_calceolata.AAC.2
MSFDSLGIKADVFITCIGLASYHDTIAPCNTFGFWKMAGFKVRLRSEQNQYCPVLCHDTIAPRITFGLLEGGRLQGVA